MVPPRWKVPGPARKGVVGGALKGWPGRTRVVMLLEGKGRRTREGRASHSLTSSHHPAQECLEASSLVKGWKVHG